MANSSAVKLVLSDEQKTSALDSEWVGLRSVVPPDKKCAPPVVNLIRMVHDHGESQINEIDREIERHEQALFVLRFNKQIIQNLIDVAEVARK